MHPPNALEIPSTKALQYFPSLEAFKDCVARAMAGARTKGEKAFAARMHEKADAYGLRTYMSSPQASKLCVIAQRVVRDTSGAGAVSAEVRPTPTLNGGW